MEVEVIKLLWLTLERLLGLGVNRIMLVIDLIKLDDTNVSNLLMILMLLEMLHNLVAHLDKKAFVSQSLEILD